MTTTLRRVMSYSELDDRSVDPQSEIYTNPRRENNDDDQSLVDRSSIGQPKYDNGQQTDEQQKPIASNSNRSRKTPHIEPFTGINQEFDTWMKLFRRSIKAKRLDNDESIDDLVLSLRGRTQDWCLNIIEREPNVSFDNLVEQLSDLNGSSKSATNYAIDLSNLVFIEDKQTIQDFMYEIIDLWYKIDKNVSFPTMVATILNKFSGNLYRQIKYKMAIVKPNNVKELTNLIIDAYNDEKSIDLQNQSLRRNLNSNRNSNNNNRSSSYDRNQRQVRFQSNRNNNDWQRNNNNWSRNNNNNWSRNNNWTRNNEGPSNNNRSRNNSYGEYERSDYNRRYNYNNDNGRGRQSSFNNNHRQQPSTQQNNNGSRDNSRTRRDSQSTERLRPSRDGCWNCGEPGHHKLNCPKLNQTIPKSKN
ncbi:GATA zinc finger domain-containing protein 4-like [Oppia nitens]|uniref:GATA zinc finger domain-containing protein 4-like n=1 Tax=Oppia nitens TaxID=1686743 RepID=UPI0023DB7675|nr:GATA zinc finger domain-containing protein 4-like [Oppia nitens]